LSLQALNFPPESLSLVQGRVLLRCDKNTLVLRDVQLDHKLRDLILKLFLHLELLLLHLVELLKGQSEAHTLLLDDMSLLASTAIQMLVLDSFQLLVLLLLLSLKLFEFFLLVSQGFFKGLNRSFETDDY